MRTIPLLFTAALVSVAAASASAHCQIPCGIYDDHARVHAMLEDVATIEKAVAEIPALAGRSDPLSFNQATRWVRAKDEHAARIITTVAEYFLTQKIQPAAASDKAGMAKYVQLLMDHHKVMRLAMQAKQTVDAKVVAELKGAVSALERHWPAPG